MLYQISEIIIKENFWILLLAIIDVFFFSLLSTMESNLKFDMIVKRKKYKYNVYRLKEGLCCIVTSKERVLPFVGGANTIEEADEILRKCTRSLLLIPKLKKLYIVVVIMQITLIVSCYAPAN